MQTASTLYWKALPVLVKQNDREEQTNELTVRILSGVNRNNHNSRVSLLVCSSRPLGLESASDAYMCCRLQILRIHVSSDEDLFFLHTLEVSEEEFQSLKIEQGILVDFGNFPGKVITLLQKCILAQTEDPPRYTTAGHTHRWHRVLPAHNCCAADSKQYYRPQALTPSSRLLRPMTSINCLTLHWPSGQAMT